MRKTSERTAMPGNDLVPVSGRELADVHTGIPRLIVAAGQPAAAAAKRFIEFFIVAIAAIAVAFTSIGFALNPEFPLLQVFVMAWLMLALLALLRRAKTCITPATTPTSDR